MLCVRLNDIFWLDFSERLIPPNAAWLQWLGRIFKLTQQDAMKYTTPITRTVFVPLVTHNRISERRLHADNSHIVGYKLHYKLSCLLFMWGQSSHRLPSPFTLVFWPYIVIISITLTIFTGILRGFYLVTPGKWQANIIKESTNSFRNLDCS
jgi:hypothetical protein